MAARQLRLKKRLVKSVPTSSRGLASRVSRMPKQTRQATPASTMSNGAMPWPRCEAPTMNRARPAA